MLNLRLLTHWCCTRYMSRHHILWTCFLFKSLDNISSFQRCSNNCWNALLHSSVYWNFPFYFLRASKNDIQLSIVIEMNLLKAAILPFKLCISLLVLGTVSCFNASIYYGLTYMSLEFTMNPKYFFNAISKEHLNIFNFIPYFQSTLNIFDRCSMWSISFLNFTSISSTGTSIVWQICSKNILLAVTLILIDVLDFFVNSYFPKMSLLAHPSSSISAMLSFRFLTSVTVALNLFEQLFNNSTVLCFILTSEIASFNCTECTFNWLENLLAYWS